jgi:hypothetical protein
VSTDEVQAEPVDPQGEDRFFIRQRVRPMVNQYEVSTLGDDGGSAGRPVCFVQQRRMKLKEDLRAYSDASKEREVFRIKAHQVFDPRARYSVTGPDGQPIGELGKVFGKSLLRSTWKVFDAGGQEVGWARENSIPIAILRRIIGLFALIPLVGELIALIPIPYHFEYFLGEERRIGQLTRKLGLRDTYLFDLSGDSERVLDRRVALALAVGMDALQAR